MTYTTPILSATFLSRPNRFIAIVELNGKPVTVHVKNTGRCKELLPPGAKVYLSAASSTGRKTLYDLVAVEKLRADGSCMTIHMDSQAPNAIAEEYLSSSGLLAENTSLRREVTCGNSRFDFAIDRPGHPTAYLEVKGCTLERDGIALFPDAPTERGVKHLRELTALALSGNPAYVLFVIQMKGVSALYPNDETHPAFGEALRKAQKAGVKILAVDCVVDTTPHPDGVGVLSVVADKPVPVIL